MTMRHYNMVIDSSYSTKIKKFMDFVESDERSYVYIAKIVELVEMGFSLEKAIDRTKELYALC